MICVLQRSSSLRSCLSVGVSYAGITMRLPRIIFALLSVCAFVTVCSHLSMSHRGLDDAMLRQKLIGGWAGSRPVGTNEVLWWKTVVHPDGTFSVQNSTQDNSGQLLHFVKMEGTFVVTNGSVVVTFTKSSENDHSLPRTIRPEPIVRVDDHELVIITETGDKSVSRKVSP